MSIQHRKADIDWDGDVEYVVNGEVVGSISYRRPSADLIRFFSQVWVSEEYRNQGIGKQMLVELLDAFPDSVIDLGDVSKDGKHMLQSLVRERGKSVLGRFRGLELD